MNERSFYDLVDIKINHKKCKLIIINPSLLKSLITMSLGTHERDCIVSVKTEARYLGVRISLKNTRSLTKQHLIRTQDEFLATLQHKQLLIRHVIYLINSVMLLNDLF
ncbi:hypothetical protein RclHR1_14780008 [Rhizophagus clarus]|uniref:Reverse transcriptase domain-containing protein n=1 Tax=Rhizophagus clarus TaxID=94130 RepID=A0A2Z6QUB0_9GLOM|nr:hypothetical protein RclHR1_14780008 [Rhizophagus clarus]